MPIKKPVARKPVQKPRGENKGPAKRSLIKRVLSRNRFGTYSEGHKITYSDYRNRFNQSTPIELPANTEVGKKIRAVLRVRKEDLVKVANLAVTFGKLISESTYDELVFEVRSQDGKGPRYFGLQRKKAPELFDRIAKEYKIKRRFYLGIAHGQEYEEPLVKE
ncbi:MAG: hypothetical protein AABW72_03775 [archaeon]